MRPAPQPPTAKHVRHRKRPLIQILWPLIALILMIAALVTVWFLLQPAGRTVTDSIDAATTTSSGGVGSSSTATTDSTVAPSTTEETTTTTEAPTTTTTIVFVDGVRGLAFDPLGDGDEHGDIAVRAIDGDPGTFWYTERYSNRELGRLKAGVGLIVEYEDSRSISRVDVRSANADWAADIYVADSVGESLDDWGTPAGSFTAIGTTAALEINPAEGRALLLWITDLGEGEPPIRLEIFEMQIG